MSPRRSLLDLIVEPAQEQREVALEEQGWELDQGRLSWAICYRTLLAFFPHLSLPVVSPSVQPARHLALIPDDFQLANQCRHPVP